MKKERTYEIVSDFNHRFKKKWGTVNCRELLKQRDMGATHSSEKPEQAQIYFCANIVSVVASLLEEALNRNR